MNAFIQYVSQLGTSLGLKLLWGILILIIGLRLTKWIVELIGKGRGFQKIEPSAQSFILSFVKVVLYAAVIASACMTWGVPSTTFVTLFTSAGVAIGLALQGALSNFAGGLMILFFKPFKVGDYIENGDVSGTVKGITMIYTYVETLDTKVVTIPNGTLTNSNVTNYTAMPIRRLSMEVSADYTNDVEKVKRVLMEVFEKHEKIKKDPEPFCRVCAHNASSIDYKIRVWVDTADYWDVYYDLMEQIVTAFNANDITIPYQQVDVKIKP